MIVESPGNCRFLPLNTAFAYELHFIDTVRNMIRPPSLLSVRPSCDLPWAALGLYLSVFASYLHPARAVDRHVLGDAGSPACNSVVYGRPIPTDCQKLLSRLPQDKEVHVFVDQQMRTAPPQADWTYIGDPRPREYQQTLVQLPKWWSHGSCQLHASTIIYILLP